MKIKTWNPKDIERLRKQLKISRASLGERLGISRVHVYYLEKGVREPSKILRLLLDCVERQFKENEKGKESDKKHGKRHL